MTKMCATLREAAEYLQTAPEGAGREEMLQNGRIMFAQIRAALERDSDHLRSTLPLEYLDAIEGQWDAPGGDVGAMMEKFSRCLPEQVVYQVRAVFFAELGEKWDSMESVYEFMRDDPRFDPIVVRTPVYRAVNQGGEQKREVIYKDFLTPMGISSLEHDQYSLEEDCPDLAFISQPYESCTPRQFWPEYIAKYTRLVYLHYGVQGKIYESFKKANCQLPVYRVAWKTAGMSERYYRFYCRYAANGGSNMLVTGFPKLDPLIRLKTKGVPMPEKWKNKIQNRKVILWNTRYSYAMSSISYFDRLTDWLQAHEDCLIIWRPHPMTDTVTKLYYSPEIYQKLLSCISRAKTLPNMIYDEEVSFRPSFYYSDAMLSDPSSMMYQYLLLNKPVCWINEKQGEFGADTGEFFVDFIWMEKAANREDAVAFLERVRNGEDRNADLRQMVMQRDLPLADGHCGERLSEALWKALHLEDGIRE